MEIPAGSASPSMYQTAKSPVPSRCQTRSGLPSRTPFRAMSATPAMRQFRSDRLLGLKVGVPITVASSKGVPDGYPGPGGISHQPNRKLLRNAADVRCPVTPPDQIRIRVAAIHVGDADDQPWTRHACGRRHPWWETVQSQPSRWSQAISSSVVPVYQLSDPISR